MDKNSPIKKNLKRKSNENLEVPILIFPYFWNMKDEEYKDNEQFHKKAKPMSPRLTQRQGIEHLLSVSKCSKRYVYGYFLNLKQLTTCSELLESIITKCTYNIQQSIRISSQQEIKNVNQRSLETLPNISENQQNDSTSKLQLLDNNNHNNNNHNNDNHNDNHSNNNNNNNNNNSDMLIPKCTSTSNCLLEKESNHSSIDIISTSQSKHSLELKEAHCVACIKHNIDLLFHWIYHYPSDFGDKTLLEHLLHFINQVKNQTSHVSIHNRWNKLLQLIQQKRPQMICNCGLNSSISNKRNAPKITQNDHEVSFYFTDSFFPPRLMVLKLGGGINLFELHPAAVGEQLTLIDTEIFLQIKIRELTNCAWLKRGNLEEFQEPPSKDSTPSTQNNDDLKTETSTTALPTPTSSLSMSDRSSCLPCTSRGVEMPEIEAPNLIYMIDHVNRLSLWVATEILTRETNAEMEDMAKYFYLVAQRCYELNNIHTCLAIFGGIQFEAVSRLQHISQCIQADKQIKLYHDTFAQLMSSDNNYKIYRDLQELWFTQDLILPCIPFIPVIIKDLYQVQLYLTPKNENNEKCIDLNLFEKNCRLIRRVFEVQQRSKLYVNELPVDSNIQTLLRMNIAKHENEKVLSNMSMQIQPKLTKEQKENFAVIGILEDVGFL